MSLASFTTEALLESAAAGFGIETLSPCQRAKARIKDGLPLGELADRDDVRRMIGCDPSALPTVAPIEEVDISGIRTLKTIGCCASAIRGSQVVDVSPARHGEVPRFFLVSTSMEQARPGFDVLVGTMLSKKALKALVIGEPTSDSIMLRHPSGCPIEIKIVPISRAGSTLVGRWCAGAVFDEAPRWQSVDEGHVMSLEDCRTAIRGRLLPGAQIHYPGSPWAPEGWPFRMFEERFGKPGADLIEFRAPARDLNPVWWTPEREAEVRAASPRTALMDLDAMFGATETSAYDLIAVGDAERSRFGEFAYGRSVLAFDPCKLMGGRDKYGVVSVSWRYPTAKRIPVRAVPPPGSGLLPDTFIGYERDEYGQTKYIDVDPTPWLSVDYADAWVGDATLDSVLERITELVRVYQPQLAVMDYGGDTQALLSHFMKLGVRAEAFSWSEQQRRAGFEWLGRIINDRRIFIPQRDLRQDLLRIQAQLRPNGTVNYFARRTAAGHADIASALVSYAIAEGENLIYGSPVRLGGGQKHEAPGR